MAAASAVWGSLWALTNINKTHLSYDAASVDLVRGYNLPVLHDVIFKGLGSCIRRIG